MIYFQDRWEAEDSLVLGLEQVALCHTRILDGLSEGDDDAMKTLKQSIETLECPVDALSNQLGTAVERMMVVERVDKRETGNRGMDGAMELMSGYIQEMISSLDVLKSGVCDISMNDFVENEDWQGHGGHLLRDIAMADCLDENLDLMVRVCVSYLSF